MKKIKELTILFTVLTMIVVNTLPVKANNADEIYEYSKNDYKTTIIDIYVNDEETVSEIIENGESFVFSADKNLNYVSVDNIYYTFTDYNLAALDQAKSISNNQSVTIVEALSNFKAINNIEVYKKEIQEEANRNIISIPNQLPRASYGTYYYVGKWKKVDFTASLVSSAIIALAGWLTGGVGWFTMAAAKTAAKEFLAGFLVSQGVDYLCTNVYYKRWQAILNSRGTTSIRIQYGADGKNSETWGKYHYTKFESQRPIY